MQTLGTALQLSGSVITFFGLLWALHVTAERLAQWRGAALSRWTRLLNSIDKWLKQPPETVEISGMFTGHGELSARAEGILNDTRPGELFTLIQNKLTSPLTDQLTSLRNHTNELAENLRTEINDAVTAEREKDAALRVWDFTPTLIGLVVSITGYICQLIG
jgi:hypothetical protein